MLQTKRVYDPPSRADGRRFLVERLWPRGMKKETLAADAWLKEVAPSTGLRQWFSHRVERWTEFRRRYEKELSEHPEAWHVLLQAAAHGTVTLLYSAHDTEHNAAVVLRDFIARRPRAPRKRAARAASGAGRQTARRTSSLKSRTAR
jgi:uncharacterized protein YeaO (DUF488 family)